MTWSGRYVPYTWNHYNCCAICAISPVDNDPVCDWQQLMVVNNPNMANQYRTSRSGCKSTVPLANCITLYISRHITCSSNNIIRSLTQTQRHGIWNALPKHMENHTASTQLCKHFSPRAGNVLFLVACVCNSISLLSRRLRQRERLHATGVSICSSVCLSVCLSVAKLQKRDFLKN